MIVIWAEQAWQEWANQYRFYFTRNPEVARRMRRLVMQGAERLRQYPRIGKPGRMEGSRELSITGTPFLVVYEEDPVRIEILHVYDARQNLEEEDA